MINNKEKHAYLIMAHSNIEQLNFLLETLDSKYADIFLHIDIKSEIDKDSIIKLKFSNIEIIKEVSVFWADFSQVECELLLLKRAVKKGYSYYHLISGLDFPLMSTEKIYRKLESCNKLFIHFTTEENLNETISFVKYYSCFQKKLHIVNRGKQFSIYKVINKLSLLCQKVIGINRIQSNLQIKKGANWFSIPNDFAEYIIKNEPFIYKQFSNTRSADEFFVQTLVYNSSFRNRIYHFKQDDSYESCLRVIDWKRGTPYIFTCKDIDELKSSKMIFARKFDYNVDKKVLIDLRDWINK
ncbi:MAG: glycosyl transferase [Clostridium sp.]|nr:glycosyl transferase [Clostridium sp.]